MPQTTRPQSGQPPERRFVQPQAHSQQAATRAAAARPVKVEVHGGDPAVAIRTSRLLLRTLEEGDAERYQALLERSRGHVDRYFPLHAVDESHHDVFVRHLRLANEGDASGRAMRRIAVDEQGELIGSFSLLSVSRGLEWKADITAWLTPELWGQGIATEAVTGLIDHAFENLPQGMGLHHINAWIVVENEQSKRLFERLGFKRASQERSFLSVNEQWHMHELWTINVNNWPGSAGSSETR